MALEKFEFEFLGAVRRFHVYREILRPFDKWLLICDFEHEDLFEMFLIKVCGCAEPDKIVAHLTCDIW